MPNPPPFKILCPCGASKISSISTRGMSRCPSCGKKYNYVLRDGKPHLYLTRQPRIGKERIKKMYPVSWSDEQDRRTTEKGYTRTQLINLAYDKYILEI